VIDIQARNKLLQLGLSPLAVYKVNVYGELLNNGRKSIHLQFKDPNTGTVMWDCKLWTYELEIAV
jgi:hypothetical protein